MLIMDNFLTILLGFLGLILLICFAVVVLFAVLGALAFVFSIVAHFIDHLAQKP